MMDLLMQYGVPIIAGIMGGGGIASAMQGADMGKTGNMIAGALGGLGGGSILAMLGAGGAAATTGDAVGGGMIGELLGGAVSGGAGGAILTGIVGTVMNKMNSGGGEDASGGDGDE